MLKEDKSNAFEVDASDLLRTGIYPERFERRIPMWDEVDGFQFTEFGMKIKPTYGPLRFDMGSDPIRGIISVQEFGTKVVYAGDLSTIDSWRLDTDTQDTVGTGYSLFDSTGSSTWDASGSVIETGSHFGNNGAASLNITSLGAYYYPYAWFTNNSLIGYTINNTTNGESMTVTGNLASSVQGTLSGGETWDVADVYELVSIQDSIWDSGSSVWDEGVITASRWSFESFGSFVFATNGVDKPQIKKNNVNFTDLYTGEASGATITDGGTGYSVSDSLSFTGGMTGTVTEVSGNAVTAFEIDNFGSGYSNGDTRTDSASGGTDCDITISVPDAPFETVEIFKKQGPHVLAFNYTKADTTGARTGEFFTSFNWCAADDPDTWVGLSTNTAGSLQIREANTPIKAVVQLGNVLACYTENQLFIITYIGPPNYFGYRTALELGGIGAASKHSVISSGRLNYGYSKDGFFETDGTTINRIGRDTGMDKYIKDNIAESELEKISGYHNASESEVSWVFPLNNVDPTYEVYYNYKTRQWGKRQTTMTSFDDHGVFDAPLAGDGTGSVWSYGGSATALIVPFALTKPHDLGEPDRIKEVTSIRIGKEGQDNPAVTLGWAEEIDDDPIFTETIFVDASFKDYCVRTAGRYLFLSFAADSFYKDFTVTDLVIQGRFEGSR